MTSFAVPGAAATYAYDVNAAGLVVGISDDGARGPGFARTVGGTFTTLDVPGSVSTSALGIDDNGFVVGRYALPGGSIGGIRGYRYDGGTSTTIGFPSATGGTTAFDISDRGDLVGFFGEARSTSGFLYTAADGYRRSGVPGAVATSVGRAPGRPEITAPAAGRASGRGVARPLPRPPAPSR
jgi:hypothetical protein